MVMERIEQEAAEGPDSAPSLDLLGNHANTLDAKRRVAIPKAFREQLADTEEFVLSRELGGDPCLALWPRARFVVRRLSTVPLFTFTVFSNKVSTNAAAAGAASLISTCCELSLSATVDLIKVCCEVSPSETGDLKAAVPALVLQIAKPAASSAARSSTSVRMDAMFSAPCRRRLALSGACALFALQLHRAMIE